MWVPKKMALLVLKIWRSLVRRSQQSCPIQLCFKLISQQCKKTWPKSPDPNSMYLLFKKKKLIPEIFFKSPRVASWKKKKTSFLPQQNSYGFSDRVPGLLKVVPGGHVRLTRRGLVGDSLALLKADWRHQNGRIFLWKIRGLVFLKGDWSVWNWEWTRIWDWTSN